MSGEDKWLAGLSKGMIQVQGKGWRLVRLGEKAGRFGWAGTGAKGTVRVGVVTGEGTVRVGAPKLLEALCR